jgi:hypothetical protein
MDGQLAVSSGVALRQHGQNVRFVELDTGWIPVTTFVLLLLTLVLGVNGIAQLWLGVTGDGQLSILGVVMLLVAVGFGYGALRCVRLRRKRERLPSSVLRSLAELDRQAGVLRDGAGRVLAPLARIHFEKRFQLGSSSRRLVVCWPEGQRDLVNGNPFAGGLWAIESELTRLGFTVR